MLIKSDVTIVDSHAGKLVIEPTQESNVAVHIVHPATEVAVLVKPGTEPTTDAGFRLDELGILLIMIGFDTKRYGLVLRLRHRLRLWLLRRRSLLPQLPPLSLPRFFFADSIKVHSRFVTFFFPSLPLLRFF